MHDLVFSPITELSRSLDTGSVDAETLTRTFLDRISGAGGALNCFITLCADTALDAARAAAMRAASGGRRGLLDGIPVAVKDNIDVAGVPTSNGFGGPPWRIPDEDAEVVRRLRASGAVILGKLNMHEGAHGCDQRQPASWPRDQSTSPRSFPWRIERRVRRGGGRRPVLHGARHRHGRIGAYSGILLRYRRIEAQFRADQHAWCRSAQSPSGSCRTAGANGG